MWTPPAVKNAKLFVSIHKGCQVWTSEIALLWIGQFTFSKMSQKCIAFNLQKSWILAHFCDNWRRAGNQIWQFLIQSLDSSARRILWGVSPKSESPLMSLLLWNFSTTTAHWIVLLDQNWTSSLPFGYVPPRHRSPDISGTQDGPNI